MPSQDEGGFVLPLLEIQTEAPGSKRVVGRWRFAQRRSLSLVRLDPQLERKEQTRGPKEGERQGERHERKAYRSRGKPGEREAYRSRGKPGEREAYRSRGRPGEREAYRSRGPNSATLTRMANISRE